jgi:translation initiation factor IF-3
MSPEDARRQAEEQGLDLVEVAPGSNPPVCRIMDYGKYKYEQKKKKQAGKAKGKAHAAALKEIKLRPRTDMHDLGFKLKNARRFLMEGDKVKVTVQFRGREIVHTRLGRDQLDNVREMLGPLAALENPPRMEGRFMSMILVPNREAVAEARRAEEESAAADEAESSEATAESTTDAKAPTEAEASSAAADEAESSEATAESTTDAKAPTEAEASSAAETKEGE